MLAVATGAEAAELRAEGMHVRVLTMGALSDGELEVALEAGSEVAVWGRRFLEAVAARGRALGITPRVHVKYDTGMGRLGERDPRVVAELVRLAADMPEVELAALWTHFATADEPGSRLLRRAVRGLHGSGRCRAKGAPVTAPARGQQRRDPA